MKDSALTKEQGLALLTKLASDDAFRSRFEEKPAHALSELIPHQTIVELPARCLCPRKLGAKAEMEEARKRLAADLDSGLREFVIPQAKL